MTLINLGLKYLLPMMAVIVAVIMSLSYPINGDVGWLYFSTQQWLGGKKLYVDIIEVNPPMIFYVMAPSVWVSNIFGLSSVVSVKLYFLLLIMFATFLHLFIMHKILPKKFFTNFYVTFCIIIVFIMPGYDFSQRDHIAILFLLPYFLCRYLKNVHGTYFRCWFDLFVGLLAGVAICLKPYFLLFPLFCELFWVVRCKSFKVLIDRQVVFQAAIFVLYIFIVVCYESAYVDKMLPLAMATYWTYGKELSSFNIVDYLFLFLLTFASSFKLVSYRERVIIQFLGVITSIALVEFLMQSHYSYQLLPFKTVLYINFLLAIYFFFHQYDYTVMVVSRVNIFFLFVTLICFSNIISKNWNLLIYACQHKSLPSFKILGIKGLEESENTINKHFSNKPIYVLSSKVWPSAFVTNYTRSIWVSGFPALWPLPAIDVLDRSPDSLTSNKKHAIEAVKEGVILKIANEILESNPAAILVDTREELPYFNKGFNFIDFFESNEHLDSIFDSYHDSGLVINFVFGGDNYKVYVKNE